MALNFPSSPSIGDSYSYADRIWLYNGKGWALQGTKSGNFNSRVYIGNGSTTTYNVTTGTTANSVLVSENGVVQEPVTDYTITGTTLTFTTAPAANVKITIHELGYPEGSSTSTDEWVRTAANSVSSYANSAFAQANTPSQVANAASSYANSAFLVANTPSQVANAASSYSNGAFDKANTANTLAQAAYDAANNATDTWVRNAANSASSYANSAYLQANTPSQVANAASSYANGAFARANTANTLAQAAYDAANTGGGSSESIIHPFLLAGM